MSFIQFEWKSHSKLHMSAHAFITEREFNFFIKKKQALRNDICDHLQIFRDSVKPVSDNIVMMTLFFFSFQSREHPTLVSYYLHKRVLGSKAFLHPVEFGIA